MAATNIHDFKQSFKGGVRPNLFRVNIQHPVGIPNIEFLCKAAQIPASTIGNIDVPFRGRQLKVPGDRTFADWTVTIINDPQFAIRAAFEDWSAKITHHAVNVSSLDHSSVYGQAQVIQMGRSGESLRTYRIEDMYPTEIAAIDLGMDTNDTIEEYTVTFAVNNWHSDLSTGFDSTGARDSSWEIGVRGRVQVGPVSIGVNTTFP
jgi:hypothetical protein